MTKRIFSLAQHTVPKWHPAEILYNSYQLGYDTVGIRTIAQGVPGETFFDIASDSSLVARIRQAEKETEVTIHDVDLIAINDKTDIPSYERSLAAAAELGITGVVSSVWTPNKPLYTEKFGQLCELAEKYGLTINLEFVTWAEVKDLKQAAELLRAVDRPNARILVDTLHWHRSRVKMEDLLACPKEWFDIIHVCDIDAYMPETNEELASTGRRERLYPGEGAAAQDIIDVVNAIQDSAIIAIEIPNNARWEALGAYEHARRCLSYTKNLLNL